jgi:hypothetical protein
LTEAQWFGIESELNALARSVETRLLRAARRHEPELGARDVRALAAEIAQLELDSSEAYTFFDTFMDTLTQRLAPGLGRVLKGCDVLAADALNRGHPALRLAGEPVVYLNRGYGAAIRRSNVRIGAAGTNPVPLIQLPYARLQEKYNLSSLLHEVGHEALVRLRVKRPLALAMLRRLRGHASRETCLLFAQWSSELGPDFWAFGCAGAAQAATGRDVLGLPARAALTVTPGAVHPPAYLRVLTAFHWCRVAFGRGPWDDWEREWRSLYLPSDVPRASRAALSDAEAAIPRASAVFFDEPLAALDGRPLASLFDFELVRPAALAAQLRGQSDESPRFAALRPAQQLAVFRLLRESASASDRRLDHAMTEWLVRLSTRHTRQGE